MIFKYKVKNKPSSIFLSFLQSFLFILFYFIFYLFTVCSTITITMTKMLIFKRGGGDISWTSKFFQTCRFRLLTDGEKEWVRRIAMVVRSSAVKEERQTHLVVDSRHLN